jgi:hypothetical protein
MRETVNHKFNRRHQWKESIIRSRVKHYLLVSIYISADSILPSGLLMLRFSATALLEDGITCGGY